MADRTVVKTSEKNWLEVLARSYKERFPVLAIDDMQIGINPESQTLFQMGQRAKLEARDWAAIIIALGVAALGGYLVVMAILDPEPFSKIAFALGSGAFMTLGGGYSAIHILTKVRPPKVKVGPSGFEIDW